MVNAAAVGGGKGFLSLALKDKAHLHASWMPFLKQGGVFVPTNRKFALGDEVFLVLTLPESTERVPVAGKVAWVTPVAAQGGRTAGIGVHFADNGENDALRGRIEALLAGFKTDKPTHTM